MRLCFMIHAVSSGGAERVLTELANHYARKSIHDVHLITLQPKGTPTFYPLDPAITLHQLGLNQTGSGGFKKAKRVLNRLFAMRRAIKHLKPHKIISFVDEMNIATLLATLGLKIPVVISERIDPRYHHIGMTSNFLRRLLYPFAHRLVVQGYYNASFFSYLKKLISVIPNPIEDHILTKNFLKSSKTIITVGRLNIQKDQELLLKAFAKIRKKHPDWCIDIYGQGPEKNRLDKLLQNLKIKNSVTFQGVTKNIAYKLSQADLFAFPSRFEGFSNALAEAMAVGLPIVASNSDGNLELIEHEKNALVFPVGDVDKLAEHLSFLMSNPQKREELGTAARKSITKFAPDKIYHMWDMVIEDQPRSEGT